jgi:hypothetical protein
LSSAKWHSAKFLPSARQKILGKDAVADVQFAERSLPSVTLGKAFAECKGKGADSGSVYIYLVTRLQIIYARLSL